MTTPATADLKWSKLSYVTPTPQGHRNGLIWIGLDGAGRAWADTGRNWATPTAPAPLADVLTPDMLVTVTTGKYSALAPETAEQLCTALGTWVAPRTSL